MAEKNWNLMSKEELLDERSRWESQLQAINLQVQTAGAVARSSGKYLGPAEYLQLKQRQLSLRAGVRGIAHAMAKLKAAQKEKAKTEGLDWNRAFRKAAYEILEEDLFEEIVEEANRLVEESDRET